MSNTPQYPNPYTYPPHHVVPPPAKPAKFHGLAWTSLILGIVGLLACWVPIFNNLTAIAAGVGVILGLIALWGTRKVLATIGLVLCVGAIAATVAVQAALAAELDKLTGAIQ